MRSLKVRRHCVWWGMGALLSLSLQACLPLPILVIRNQTQATLNVVARRTTCVAVPGGVCEFPGAHRFAVDSKGNTAKYQIQ